MHIAIRPVQYSDIMDAPNFAELVREYAAECSVPDAEPQPAIYLAMEQAGVFKCFAAYLDDILIGFCSLVCVIVPHDGHLVGTCESLFVAPAYRHTSAFEDLFAAAEQLATDTGCRILSCSARVGSALDKVLSRRAGYSLTHSQHTKWLGEFAKGRK